MCSSKKHDKSLTYTGSGLRVAYAQHAFFIFVNIDKKGMSERPFRLRGLRRMTQQKKVQSLKLPNSLHQQYIYTGCGRLNVTMHK